MPSKSVNFCTCDPQHCQTISLHVYIHIQQTVHIHRLLVSGACSTQLTQLPQGHGSDGVGYTLGGQDAFKHFSSDAKLPSEVVNVTNVELGCEVQRERTLEVLLQFILYGLYIHKMHAGVHGGSVYCYWLDTRLEYQ